VPEARAGAVLLDKPPGPSSFAALRSLRPVYGRRLGHAGTLDPFASGLLIVLVGRATRLAHLAQGAEKEYEATVRLGSRSTTDDPEGELTPTGIRVTEAAVAAALPRFVGEISQVPPAASAVHVDGERAYRRFRRGEQVAMPARTVVVHDLAVMRFDGDAQEVAIRVRCGSGTYVRSLARDLGDALGCGAHLTALRRTRIGRFSVEDAASPEEIAAGPAGGPGWRTALDLAADLPRRALVGEEADLVAHGRVVPAGTIGERLAPDAEVALVVDDRLLAVARRGPAGLHPRIVLEPA